MRRSTGATALAAVLVGVAVLSLSATAADDDLDLVSRATGVAGAGADGESRTVSISADGRRVAFLSDADNLSAEDVNTAANVFVRDLEAGTTTLVTRASGAAGAPANLGSLGPRLSADGLSVAFSSGATTLSPDDASELESIYLRRLDTQVTTLVSRATGATGASADGSSFQPTISADGRFVAFQSNSSNLSGDATATSYTNIFVRDTVTNTTTLVSRAGGPGGAQGDSASLQPAISADGRYVAFSSMATNLSPDDGDATQDIFVRDRLTDTTALVSRASGPAGAAADMGGGAPALSPDGRFVTFSSGATNLSPEDDDDATDVFVRDLTTNATILASRAEGPSGAPGDDSSGISTMSADGRFITFASVADNLSAEDDNGVRNVFVRDLLAGTTRLVSRAPGPAGAPATGGDSVSPWISSDGRHVAFESDADNLSADDVNSVKNIFARTLAPPAALPTTPTARPSPTPAGGRTITARCAGVRATIVGTARRNVIRGTAKRDVIAALGGSDLVRGLGGNDLICLGAGNDRGIGGAGADRILGQAGADRAEGGLGRDLLEGGLGSDLLLGGAGIDRLLGLAGRDRAVGGAGSDVCRVELRTAC